MERTTTQKQQILIYLRGTKSHPTAAEVYDAVRENIPHISKGTVYRNLDIFVKNGLIREISGVQKRFDADLSIHSHFCCEKCDCIIDIHDNPITRNNVDYVKGYGDVVTCDVYFRGICNACL